MDNRRRHTRHPLEVDVKITHPDIGEKIVKTKNISDSGLFLIVEPTEMPAIGDVVQGQIQGMLDDAPVVKMKIVRVEEEGLGLQFIDI
ncbi:MAG: PilZ domain-containing protein [Gammaproteobacteria bacterium]|nr:PilZ domain-containing protein [Gammaproteobacteria bacterium]